METNDQIEDLPNVIVIEDDANELADISSRPIVEPNLPRSTASGEQHYSERVAGAENSPEKTSGEPDVTYPIAVQPADLSSPPEVLYEAVLEFLVAMKNGVSGFGSADIDPATELQINDLRDILQEREVTQLAVRNAEAHGQVTAVALIRTRNYDLVTSTPADLASSVRDLASSLTRALREMETTAVRQTSGTVQSNSHTADEPNEQSDRSSSSHSRPETYPSELDDVHELPGCAVPAASALYDADWVETSLTEPSQGEKNM